CLLLSSVLPAKSCEPVCESWMMIGALAARAAAIAAFAELEPMTFTAGRANPASLPYAKSSFTALPVRTPGLRVSLFMFTSVYDDDLAAPGAALECRDHARARERRGEDSLVIGEWHAHRPAAGEEAGY